MHSLRNRIDRKIRLRRSVMAMAVAAVILILTLAAAVFVTGQLYRDAHRWTLHSYRVREHLLELVGRLQLAEMEARGYGLTGRDGDFQQYWRDIAAVEHDATQLADLVADNPAQVAAAKQLQAAIDARRTQFERILDDYRAHGPEASHADVIALVSRPDRPVRELAAAMLDREATLLAQREQTSERYGKRVTIVAALALSGCLALLLAALINSGSERRQQRGELELERNALHLQQALREANHSSGILRRLSTLAELLQNCRDLDEAVNVIERALPPLLPDVSGALSLINASRNIVEARMHWDARGSDLGSGIFAPDDCWALRRSQSHPGEDMPCRFGGEEFTLVLTDADHAKARERAEAIRKATAELVVHYRAGTLPPATVSIGVASYPEHGDTPDALMRMADQALYRAKQLGRNVVGSAGDLAHTAHPQAARADA